MQDQEDDARVRQGRPYCGACSSKHSSGFTAKALTTVMMAVAASVPDDYGQNQVSIACDGSAATCIYCWQVPCEQSPLPDIQSALFRDNHVVYLESLLSPENGMCRGVASDLIVSTRGDCARRFVHFHGNIETFPTSARHPLCPQCRGPSPTCRPRSSGCRQHAPKF